VFENIIWLSRKYNQKYVGVMAPFAKKVPDPCYTGFQKIEALT